MVKILMLCCLCFTVFSVACSDSTIARNHNDGLTAQKGDFSFNYPKATAEVSF